MQRFLSLLTAVVLFTTPIFAEKGDSPVSTPLSYKTKTLDGKELDLTSYKGKVVLVINVASQCGYTSQYKGMQELYEKFSKAGLVVLGVPSNEFGGQEPGSNEEIAKFCKTNYGVTFPILEKQMVKGANASPLYKFLTSKETNTKSSGDVKWNFTKFLLGKEGEILGRFESGVDLDDAQLTGAIETALKK